MSVDHELMKSLEYDGPYGARYMCGQCAHFSEGNCGMLPESLTVSPKNNVCRNYNARIKNPSAPEFNLDDYLEFLYSDYYRPWNVDTSIIVGYIDRPSFYTHDKRPEIPLYKSYDKPYCRVNPGPRCNVKVGVHNFEIDYRKYRELAFITEDNEVSYVVHYWKDTPTQRKYNRETNGKWAIENGR